MNECKPLAVGTNENGVNGPMQGLTKVSLPADALGGAKEVEWVPDGRGLHSSTLFSST